MSVTLRVFLDEGVPASVGKAFSESGHEVIYLPDATPRGSPDPLVCAVSEANDAILVAYDNDMRLLAQRRGAGKRPFRRLSLIKYQCRESRAAERTREAMSLIEHEWAFSHGMSDRRMFIVSGDDVIRTHR